MNEDWIVIENGEVSVICCTEDEVSAYEHYMTLEEGVALGHISRELADLWISWPRPAEDL